MLSQDPMTWAIMVANIVLLVVLVALIACRRTS